MSNTVTEVGRREQLGQKFNKIMETLSKSCPPDKLAQVKELSEVFRKELESELECNETLWTEKKMLQTLNSHMKNSIDESRELIDELKKLMEEPATEDWAR